MKTLQSWRAPLSSWIPLLPCHPSLQISICFNPQYEQWPCDPTSSFLPPPFSYISWNREDVRWRVSSIKLKRVSFHVRVENKPFSDILLQYQKKKTTKLIKQTRKQRFIQHIVPGQWRVFVSAIWSFFCFLFHLILYLSVFSECLCAVALSHYLCQGGHVFNLPFVCWLVDWFASRTTQNLLNVLPPLTRSPLTSGADSDKVVDPGIFSCFL